MSARPLREARIDLAAISRNVEALRDLHQALWEAATDARPSTSAARQRTATTS